MIKKIRSSYFLKALGVSIRIKSITSLLINIIGFFTAFLPMLISLNLKDFTEKVQLLSRDVGLLNDVLIAFGIITVLYITQIIFNFVQNYYTGEDSERVKRYLKEQMTELLISIPYKYTENYDGFLKKIEFVKGYAGEKVAGSMSLIFSWIADIISFISVIYILYIVNIWIVVILIVTCIPAVILSGLQKDEDYRMRAKWMKEGTLTIHYSDQCRLDKAMKDLRFLAYITI